MVKIQFYQAGHPHEVQEIEIDVSPSSSATMLMKQLEDHMTGAVIVDITFGKSMYENVLIFMAIAYFKSEFNVEIPNVKIAFGSFLVRVFGISRSLSSKLYVREIIHFVYPKNSIEAYSGKCSSYQVRTRSLIEVK